MRASGSDNKLLIAPAIKFSLEEYMEYIEDDEYLEITPIKLRLRKIILDELERKRRKKSSGQ
jgi:GTP-binding protein